MPFSAQGAFPVTQGQPAGTRRIRIAMLGALYLFLASSYFSIAINSLALGAMALCWLALMVRDRRFSVEPTPLDYYFLAYAVAEILATAFSVDRAQSLLFSKRLLLIGIVYFLASEVSTARLAQNVMIVLLGSAAGVAAIGVLKMLFANPESVVRLGIFQFYMTTSELMMIALLLILPFVIHARTPLKVRIAAAAGLIPVAVALYGTVTRGAYLAASAGIVCIALVRNKRLLIPFVVIVALVLLFSPPYVHDRLASIVDLHHHDNASRLLLWSTGWKIFLDHPLVGVGDIDLGRLLPQYAGGPLGEPWGHLHNVFMQVLVTLGVLGTAAFWAMFVRIAILEWRNYRSAKNDWFLGSVTLGALAVFVGFVVNGLTEWSFGDQEVVILFWITLGMSIAAGKMMSRLPGGT